MALMGHGCCLVRVPQGSQGKHELKAIVHIGAEKTNAGSIQQFLYLNRKSLQDAGYHFLQSAGETNNRALPAYCVSTPAIDDYFRMDGITTPEEREAFNKQFLTDFEAELRGLPDNVHTVLISSEHFHSRIVTEADMDNVHQLLSGHFEEVTIVCYLREQVSSCTRRYSSFLKAGGRASFGKFLEDCKPKNIQYNYLDMMANWERCFGLEALDVCLFTKDRFLNNDLFDDFTAKIDPALVGKLNRDVRLENESLRPAGQVLARAVNLVFPLKSKVPEVRAFREQCQSLIAQRMAGRGQQADLKTWQSIYNDFAESNEQLRQKFFSDVDTLFVEPFEMELPRNVIDEEFTELLLEIVALIKQSGIDMEMPKAYARLWSVISTCVTEMANFQGGMRTGPEPVTLSPKDGHLLKDIALRIEERYPQATFKLMTLASRVLPNAPVIKNKLKQYSKKDDSGQPSDFIVTYHGGAEPSDQQAHQQLHERFGSWLETLQVPSGSSMVPVKDNKVLKADSILSNESRSSMVGYTIFQAGSLEEAIVIAKKCPHLETGGTVEVSEISAPATQ